METPPTRRQADTLFEIAARFARRPEQRILYQTLVTAQPVLLVLAGLPHAGKSAFAATVCRLANPLIPARTLHDPHQKARRQAADERDAPAQRLALYRQYRDLYLRYLANKQVILLDGPHLTPASRHLAEEPARRHAPDRLIVVVHFKATLDTCLRRHDRRRQRLLDRHPHRPPPADRRGNVLAAANAWQPPDPGTEPSHRLVIDAARCLAAVVRASADLRAIAQGHPLPPPAYPRIKPPRPPVYRPPASFRLPVPGHCRYVPLDQPGFTDLDLEAADVFRHDKLAPILQDLLSRRAAGKAIVDFDTFRPATTHPAAVRAFLDRLFGDLAEVEHVDPPDALFGIHWHATRPQAQAFLDTARQAVKDRTFDVFLKPLLQALDTFPRGEATTFDLFRSLKTVLPPEVLARLRRAGSRRPGERQYWKDLRKGRRIRAGRRRVPGTLPLIDTVGPWARDVLKQTGWIDYQPRLTQSTTTSGASDPPSNAARRVTRPAHWRLTARGRARLDRSRQPETVHKTGIVTGDATTPEPGNAR